MNRRWASDAIKELRLLEFNRGGFIQLFSQALLLGPKNEPLRKVNSFCYQRSLGKTYHEVSNDHHDYWHPGFAWAASLNTLIKFSTDRQYLIDCTIGGADRHMAMSFVDLASQTVPDNVSDKYKEYILNWQSIVKAYELKTSVIDGTIKHYWHGDLADRKYLERWSIYIDNDFVPLDYKYRDNDNLLIYRYSNTKLQNDIYLYFSQRNEDSTIVKKSKKSNKKNHHTTSSTNDDSIFSFWPFTGDSSNDSDNHSSHHHHHHSDHGTHHHHHHSDNDTSGWQGYC